MENCKVCKKKSLMLVSCSCGKKLCLKHRYPEDHNCTRNFVSENKDSFIKK